MTFLRYLFAAALFVFPAALASSFTYTSSPKSGDELYMPRNIKRAFERGTRSLSGEPGKQYWQNAADYDIYVRINTATRLLRGTQTITYHNNSLDTLRTIVLKLHQNMNRRGAARLSPLGDSAVTDGMRIGVMKVDGVERNFLPDAGDARIDQGTCIVSLPSPLPPASQVNVEVAWDFTIPVTTGEGGGNPRMGAYENGSMFLAYWYPKMAVYDDVRGWDMHSYNGEHEFYCDYGDFRVEIDVPEHYGVWATGMLQNDAAVLREPALSRYRAALVSDSVVRIVDEAEAQGQSPYLEKNGRSRWVFTGENIPDFAFGLARGYRWDGVAARVDDRRVFVDVAYDPASTSFVTAADEGRITVEMLSAARPGVPFPYPAVTVFNGYYGMEFPMIVNDGEFHNRVLNVYVHSHEIAHSYFPFMVGIDETRYAWMDEGMAYFLPVDVQKSLSQYDHMIRAARGYERFAGTERDFPLLLPSTASSGDDLQIMAYLKPALAFAILRESLGAETFDAALRTFMLRWEGKHPLPWDFFHTFNEVAGESLNWFWSPWFFEPGYPDLAIAKVEEEEGGSVVTVRRVGSMPVPVHMQMTLENGATEDVVKTAAIWKDGGAVAQFRVAHAARLASVRIGASWIPDANPTDNTWKQ
jgi:hypothetical protein